MPDYGHEFDTKVNEIGKRITLGMRSRGYRAANELRNASQLVLRGQRSGKRYAIPNSGAKRRHRDKVTGRLVRGRRYTASAPGEPPAVRTGVFRASWSPVTLAAGVVGKDGFQVTSKIRNPSRTNNGRYYLAEILEDGTGRMASRPFRKKIQDKALPKIVRIYREPY